MDSRDELMATLLAKRLKVVSSALFRHAPLATFLNLPLEKTVFHHGTESRESGSLQTYIGRRGSFCEATALRKIENADNYDVAYQVHLAMEVDLISETMF